MKMVDLRVISVPRACPLDVLCSQVHLDVIGGRHWHWSSTQSWLFVLLWTNLGIKTLKNTVKY